MELKISLFFLIIILSNFIIIFLWYLFSNNLNKTTAKWDEVYNITKYPMDNFIGTDMNQILRDCDILYHQLTSLLKIGIIDKNDSILYNNEPVYNGYKGSELWSEIFSKCKKSKNGQINFELLLGYKSMIDMQIGIMYQGYTNLPFLMNTVFNNFKNLYSMLLFYQKIFITFAQTRQIFFEGKEVRGNLSKYLNYANLTQSEKFIGLLHSVYNIDRILKITNGINKFLLLFSNKKIIETLNHKNSTLDDNCITSFHKIINKIKNDQIKTQSNLDVKGMKIINKINTMDENKKIKKKELFYFFVFFQKFSKSVVHLKIVDSIMRKNKSNRTKKSFMITLFFIMIIFFINFSFYKIVSEKKIKNPKKKHTN